MASWVITIAKKQDDHWSFALRDKVWDMPNFHDIRSGDNVYFRLSGGPLLGWGKVTENARPLTISDEVPWHDGREPYSWRFTFQPISDKVARPSSWAKVRTHLQVDPKRLQTVQRFDLTRDDLAIQQFFLTPLEDIFGQLVLGEDTQEPEPLIIDELSEDQRRVVERLQAIREGQSAFRQELLHVYGGCAVTGTRFEAALDAAHISPYKGPHSNKVRNGLILRKDVHRLFDLDLLTLEDDGTIRVSPEVTEPIYRDLDGRTALLPSGVTSRPDPKVLQSHRARCTWLASAAAEPAAVTNNRVLF